jgi:glycosyltransferase involved in cell wall biosynthesis
LGSTLPEYDPKLTDFQSLGIRRLEIATDRWIFDCGYPIWAVDSVEDRLEECFACFGPDIVWANSFPSLPVLRTARERGLAAVWYIHDCRPGADDLRSAAEHGVNLVAVTQFIRDRVEREAGHPCAVVYPLVAEEDYRLEHRSPRYVTFINPRPVKGYDVFLALAPLLPDVPFLVLEAWPLGAELPKVEARLAALPNIRFVRQLADPREVYRETLVLLVPSLVAEGGPRVIREAQLNGIPVLGSARGGVPELIGDGGRVILDDANPEAWARALREVLSDSRLHDEMARAAITNAHREPLTSDGIGRRFAAALSAAFWP